MQIDAKNAHMLHREGDYFYFHNNNMSFMTDNTLRILEQVRVNFPYSLSNAFDNSCTVCDGKFYCSQFGELFQCSGLNV